MICLQVEKSVASLATMHVLVVLSAGKGFQGVLARWTLVGLIEKIGEPGQTLNTEC